MPASKPRQPRCEHGRYLPQCRCALCRPLTAESVLRNAALRIRLDRHIARDLFPAGTWAQRTRRV